MKIGIDTMGGDFAPAEVLKGIQQYLSESNGHVVLIGDERELKPLLSEYTIPKESYTVVHATQVIDMHDHPTRALKEKSQSSISIGFHLLASGEIDAFISAGNTGAMLVGSLYALKPIEGVLRPTISTIIPKENGGTGLLLDVGLNSDCKPEQLNQFAVMGSVYAETILGIEKPRVALINIGEEEGKGNILAQATYPLLKENTHINFIGNVEGRDIFLDKADVMVCDGLNYNRQGIAAQLDLQVHTAGGEDLSLLVKVLQERLCYYGDKTDTVQRLSLNKKEVLFRQGIDAYHIASAKYAFLTYAYPSLKSSLFTPLGHYFGFTGYYNPFSAEAQIKTTVPVFIKPFVLCHEIAHQLGYAKENEANFVSFLAGRKYDVEE